MRVASAINHPNLAHIYDVGQDGDTLYYTIKLIEGVSLEHRNLFATELHDHPRFQRLVRLICNSCKQEARASRQQLIESALEPNKYQDYTFYEGKGCIDCNGTGYRGRTAIAELLDMSDRIKEMEGV